MITALRHTYTARGNKTTFTYRPGFQRIDRYTDIVEDNLNSHVTLNIPQIISRNSSYTVSIHTYIRQLLAMPRANFKVQASTLLYNSRARCNRSQPCTTHPNSKFTWSRIRNIRNTRITRLRVRIWFGVRTGRIRRIRCPDEPGLYSCRSIHFPDYHPLVGQCIHSIIYPADQQLLKTEIRICFCLDTNLCSGSNDTSGSKRFPIIIRSHNKCSTCRLSIRDNDRLRFRQYFDSYIRHYRKEILRIG